MGTKGAFMARLMIVGDSSCGKTSLVLMFVQNIYYVFDILFLFSLEKAIRKTFSNEKGEHRRED